jgi:hypothetical protein
VYLGDGLDTVDKVAAYFDAISDRSIEHVPQSGSEQGSNEVAKGHGGGGPGRLTTSHSLLCQGRCSASRRLYSQRLISDALPGRWKALPGFRVLRESVRHRIERQRIDAHADVAGANSMFSVFGVGSLMLHCHATMPSVLL